MENLSLLFPVLESMACTSFQRSNRVRGLSWCHHLVFDMLGKPLYIRDAKHMVIPTEYRM